ncbi:MAG: DUF2284 domain-containing protein [Rikenellaceae bacterium]
MTRTEETITTIEIKKYIAEYRNVEYFLGFCHQCKGFGKTWACPPFEQQIDLDSYNFAHIIGTKIIIDPKRCEEEISGDELTKAIEEILLPVRLQIDLRLLELEKLNSGSRAFFAGSCRRCAKGECTRPKAEPCIKPNEMRPSLEAVGFDVSKSASQLLGIDLLWCDKHLPQYFTLVYALFSQKRELIEQI